MTTATVDGAYATSIGSAVQFFSHPSLALAVCLARISGPSHLVVRSPTRFGEVKRSFGGD
jgi:hypothetical protein